MEERRRFKEETLSSCIGYLLSHCSRLLPLSERSVEVEEEESNEEGEDGDHDSNLRHSLTLFLILLHSSRFLSSRCRSSRFSKGTLFGYFDLTFDYVIDLAFPMLNAIVLACNSIQIRAKLLRLVLSKDLLAFSLYISITNKRM